MTTDRWFGMSISEQILNIGGEIQRAVDNDKREGHIGLASERTREYLGKAFEWINLSELDPKNYDRIGELDAAKSEVIDYFGRNTFGNDSESIMGYWNSFNSATCIGSMITH